jgi:hypothetical protein
MCTVSYMRIEYVQILTIYEFGSMPLIRELLYVYIYSMSASLWNHRIPLISNQHKLLGSSVVRTCTLLQIALFYFYILHGAGAVLFPSSYTAGSQLFFLNRYWSLSVLLLFFLRVQLALIPPASQLVKESAHCPQICAELISKLARITSIHLEYFWQ